MIGAAPQYNPHGLMLAVQMITVSVAWHSYRILHTSDHPYPLNASPTFESLSPYFLTSLMRYSHHSFLHTASPRHLTQHNLDASLSSE